MLIYTKTGDTGTTSLAGGQRIKKNNLRIESYGTSDELNSFIGLAISFGTDDLTTKYLTQIQNQIFDLGADLSILPEDKIKFKLQEFDYSYTKSLEEMIDHITQKLDPLKEFILPGGSKTSSYLHACRTICRRTERQVITLSEAVDDINPNCIKYLNRLSDLLFVLARYENHVKQIPEPKWKQTKVNI